MNFAHNATGTTSKIVIIIARDRQGTPGQCIFFLPMPLEGLTHLSTTRLVESNRVEGLQLLSLVLLAEFPIRIPAMFVEGDMVGWMPVEGVYDHVEAVLG